VRLGDARFTSTGLSSDAADAAVPDPLDFARQARTNAEFEAWLAERFGALPEPGPWRAPRPYTPLLDAPTGGPWSCGWQLPPGDTRLLTG
jgi:hypothetical protein